MTTKLAGVIEMISPGTILGPCQLLELAKYRVENWHGDKIHCHSVAKIDNDKSIFVFYLELFHCCPQKRSKNIERTVDDEPA